MLDEIGWNIRNAILESSGIKDSIFNFATNNNKKENKTKKK